MRSRYRWSYRGEVFELFYKFDLPKADRAHVVEFHSELAARSYLHRFVDDYFITSALRSELRHAFYFSGLIASAATDRELWEQIASRLAWQELFLTRRVLTPPAGRASKKEEEEAAARARTFIKVDVLWAEGRDPVPGLTLELTAPNGEHASKNTNQRGLARLDGITEGACVVGCYWRNLRVEECVTPVPEGGRPKARDRRAPAPRAIVEVCAHKVRRGETLVSLAESVNASWQELAYFNWGTRDPSIVNAMLASRLGCTRTAENGRSYVFDDDDDPGIIYLPRPFNRGGLQTGRLHTIEVQPIVEIVREDVAIPMPRDFDEDPYHDDEVRLVAVDGSYEARLASSDPEHVVDKGEWLYYCFRAVPAGSYEVLATRGGQWLRLYLLEVGAAKSEIDGVALAKLDLETIEYHEPDESELAEDDEDDLEEEEEEGGEA